MKKLGFSLLTICLLFLCACGGAEEETATASKESPAAQELPDARALWQEAEEIAASWDCVDADISTVTSAEIRGLKQVFVQETRIKGRDINGDKPIYQAVTTGDMPSEAYYSDGWLYVSGDFGSYKQKTDIDGLASYLGEGSLEVGPDSFADVRHVSQENGWKLAFSIPSEDFVSAFKESFALEEMSYKEGSLEVVGSVELTEEHELSRVAMDISAVFAVEGEDITLRVKTAEQIFDHEEPRITLPSKLKLYTETNDVRLPEDLYSAFYGFESAVAVDFEARMDFKGSLGGAEVDLGESQHGYMQIDPETLLTRYLSEWTNWYNGEEQDHYVVDYNGSIATYTRKDYVEEIEIKEENVWNALYNDLY